MAEFSDHLKAAAAKKIVSLLTWGLLLVIVSGAGWYFYNDLKHATVAAVTYPFSKAKEKAVAAKGAVVEKTGAVASNAGERIGEATDKVVDTVRERTPEVVDKAKELGSAGVEKAKEVGGDLKDRFKAWREKKKEE